MCTKTNGLHGIYSEKQKIRQEQFRKSARVLLSPSTHQQLSKHGGTSNNTPVADIFCVVLDILPTVDILCATSLWLPSTLCSNVLVDRENFRDDLLNVREKERLFDKMTEFHVGRFVSLRFPKAAKVHQ